MESQRSSTRTSSGDRELSNRWLEEEEALIRQLSILSSSFHLVAAARSPLNGAIEWFSLCTHTHLYSLDEYLRSKF